EVIKDPHVYTDPRRPATVVTGFVHDYPDEIVFVGGSRHEYTDDGVVVVTRDRFRVQAPAPVSVATALN
ncbi:MAG: hypothetical protein HW383_689, partial [Candidatus Magasanikbacteria bacterium]|nr:hypothetical protein [Candidatus Magasanikbacteria bacterium]